MSLQFPPSLNDLLDLQTVDSDIDRLIHERQSLPVLAEYRRAHEEAARRQAARDETVSTLRQTELSVDKTSGELDLAERKLTSEQNRLYAGGLSARDADYLRREVDMLDRKKRDMEEEVLELMEARDRLAARLEELEVELATATEEKAAHEAVIVEAWKEIDAKLGLKERRKAEIVPLIPEDLLELYDRLRPTMDDGVAVGRLTDDGVCGACHLRLSATEQIEVRKSDPPRCIHCRAILVP